MTALVEVERLEKQFAAGGAWLRRRGKQLELNGTASGRLFRRGTPPAEVTSGTDVSWLLNTPSRFDTPDAWLSAKWRQVPS